MEYLISESIFYFYSSTLDQEDGAPVRHYPNLQLRKAIEWSFPLQSVVFFSEIWDFFLSLQVWGFEIHLVFGEIQVLGLFSDGRKCQRWHGWRTSRRLAKMAWKAIDLLNCCSTWFSRAILDSYSLLLGLVLDFKRVFSRFCACSWCE